MRHIERLLKPRKLVDKEAEWQAQYEAKLAANPKARPDHSKYAHQQIEDLLYEMSNGKCFYCEYKVPKGDREVDHFVEVAIDPSKAYDWDNLYFSCSNCNDKLDHLTIPVTNVLNPCRDSDEEIQRHITFVEEQIRPVDASKKGLDTIKKYKLDSELQDLRRGRCLRSLMGKVIKIQKEMIAEGRHDLSEEEKRSILNYMSPDQPYSLMCEVYIKTNFKQLIA